MSAALRADAKQKTARDLSSMIVIRGWLLTGSRKASTQTFAAADLPEADPSRQIQFGLKALF